MRLGFFYLTRFVEFMDKNGGMGQLEEEIFLGRLWGNLNKGSW